MNRKVVLALSGGLDSTTALAWALERGYEVTAVSFTYGSKHNPYENMAARQVAAYYGVRLIPVDVSPVFRVIESDLLTTGGDIPEGHYEAESMKRTVVPGRNLIFASVLAGIAESIGAGTIMLGVHQGDHAIYPDCRPDFIASLSQTVLLSSDCRLRCVAPLLHAHKGMIVQWGLSPARGGPVPYHLTRTCYKAQEVACGKCGACRERLEAFRFAKAVDPVQYQVGG